ncbi:uncharacterized protein LOC126553053 [Aphis gossypii]|uniref:uncharacterized protein LOC126553053 n=1 Tax=Aphis gossypii TaxID=80765 RepID=UPI002158B936|nr:uncharacterized protein LOC126553053 [Aphis gossypii]
MGQDEDLARSKRAKVRAIAKRDSYAARIKAIHATAQLANNDATIAPQLLVASAKLDDLWAGFQTEDNAVFEAFCDLDMLSDYTTDLCIEVSELVDYAKAVMSHYHVQPSTPVTSGDRVDHGKSVHSLDGSVHTPVLADESSTRVVSRLPEIPLPQFDGDLHKWPAFRDRFVALVSQRPNISNIERYYYLVGCVHGVAADVIRGIPISGATFDLAWSALVSRFDKPRLVASSVVDDLLQVPVSSVDSLTDLNKFMAIFGESVAVLTSLQVPDLGDFILFSLASRCLSASCRTLFESQLTTDFPKVEGLFEFVRSRIAVLERVQGVAGKQSEQASRKREQSKVPPKWPRKIDRPPPTSLVSAASVQPAVAHTSSVCTYCNNSHSIDVCRKFGLLSVDDRTLWARNQRICFTCLGSDHWANRCKASTKCKICSRRHHSLLHSDTKDAAPPSIAQPPVVATSLLSRFGGPSVMLGTALVHIRDHSGTYQVARALIDSASHINAISLPCAKRLGFRWSNWTAPISGLAGVPVPTVQGRVQCHVVPRFASDPALSFESWVLPSITSDLPRRSLEPSIRDKFSHLALADPDFNIAAPVDILLGADLFSSIMDGRQVMVDKSLPAAFSSCFGWILIGSVSSSNVPEIQEAAVSLLTSVEQLIERFWHIEEPDVAPLTFTDAGKCESIFRENLVRDESGRFAVPLPFRVPLHDKLFPGSRAVAAKRFERLERKLGSDVRMRAKYNEFMSEYASLGHMSVASSPGQYFIPHHAVCGADEKFRVVFDASAAAADGTSLNMSLFAGPKLQQDIVDVLTRFRLFRHAFTTDICKMYRQITVLPQYRTYQHIFWRSSPHQELVEYELNTVTYGVNCAPFLALRVLQEVADVDCHSFAHACDALRHQTYVDDICYGADTVNDVLSIQAELTSVLAGAGFELRKWASNTAPVLQAVPDEFRVIKSTSFAGDEGGETKVLGLSWHTGGDYFGCEAHFDSAPVFTKRGMLSLTARFFDPLGLFAPSTFLAKHIMQRTWQSTCSWDQRLPIDIHQDWAQFVAELPVLASVHVPRYFNTKIGARCSLYGFCDASQRGYAAVVFLRVHDAPRESSIILVGSKTKLAPLKPISVPRLELNAAVLLSRWMSRVLSLLNTHLNIVDMWAWTDSSIVLSWLTVPHDTFKQYVSNRVHSVQTLLPNCQWRHVTSEMNPADCASRGLMPSELPHHQLYWSGPPFLRDPSHEWGSDIPRLPVAELPEVKSVSLTVCLTATTVEWFTRFSSYDELIRVVARVRRFINICRRRPVESSTALTKAELDGATRAVIAASQHTTFPSLFIDLEKLRHIKHRPLARLCPFVDSEGIIRVGGRLRHSELPYDHRHPVLLAKESHLAVLVCRHWHKVTGHSGPRIMTALIHRKYWIVSLRSVIHSVISQCTRCVRLRATVPVPIMADLPESRVLQCRPFSRVGVDYAGPIPMRENRLRKSRTYKAYIAVFVCLGVKAVHLELVSDLSTSAFLAAFDRFVARRGLPTTVYSDCGTNFVGADRQLRQLVNSATAQATITSAKSYCEWKFNPPSAPHFGGLWEAAVRSAKRLLSRIMGAHSFTYEEFTTVLCRVEAVLNSRPLTPASTDPHDLESLSPGHFLICQPLLALPPRTSEFPERSLTDRWKLLDHCHQAFWRRWSTEYLQTLQERNKWTHGQSNIEIGQMVTIRDNLAPPLEWRLGRVLEVLPGKDGVVRVARVLTSRGMVTRPVVKLVLLPGNCTGSLV